MLVFWNICEESQGLEFHIFVIFVLTCKGAMREVDSDGSGTMDFYEYLQVAMLVERRKGKCQRFGLLITNFLLYTYYSQWPKESYACFQRHIKRGILRGWRFNC